jgi:hypothetical protein
MAKRKPARRTGTVRAAGAPKKTGARSARPSAPSKAARASASRTRKAAKRPALSAKKRSARRPSGKKLSATKAVSPRAAGRTAPGITAGKGVKKPAKPIKEVARKRAAPRAAAAPARASAPAAAKRPHLDRARRTLDDTVQTPPSSLDLDRHATAARSGRAALRNSLKEHTGMTPELTAGDSDGDWENAYFSGEEAPGGDNPSPDQNVVDDIGRALGVEYQDGEELKASDKVGERDEHRWELDPASAEDYKDRK